MAATVVVLCVLRFKMKMCVYVTICFGLLLAHQPVLSTTVNNTTETLAVLYEKGVESYLDERWADCIRHFEHALQDYRNLKQTTVDCRVKCRYQSEESQPMFPENIENLQYYEKLIKKTLCLLKCKKQNIKMDIQTSITKETEKLFEDLKPYEYLQLCYFQKNLLQKAASSVFTFLVVNPTNDVMLSNLKFYSTLPEVNLHEIINFEAQKFVSLYIHGAEAYDNEDYPSVIHYLEESLEDYLKSEEDCRAYCEGSFDQGWFPDFASSVSNHFTFCLKCKDKCASKLNTLNGERHEDLLPSHYHFLQFAYYKVGNLKRACEAVASYLLFYPADLTMLNNKDIYSKMPKFKLEYFTPRDEAVKYVKRHEYESALLKFIEKEFIFDDPQSKDSNAKFDISRSKDESS